MAHASNPSVPAYQVTYPRGTKPHPSWVEQVDAAVIQQQQPHPRSHRKRRRQTRTDAVTPLADVNGYGCGSQGQYSLPINGTEGVQDHFLLAIWGVARPVSCDAFRVIKKQEMWKLPAGPPPPATALVLPLPPIDNWPPHYPKELANDLASGDKTPSTIILRFYKDQLVLFRSFDIAATTAYIYRA